jgi:GTP-binding protein Era
LHVGATLIVERERHKPIVIGRQGSMLRTIGTDARKAIEALVGRRVFLEVFVKVEENWRMEPRSVRGLGFH